jgi:hypothetical protein
MTDKLNLFTSPSAFPNPQRLRIFMHEKGIADQFNETIYDMSPVGEQRSWKHLKMNQWGETPTLALADGSFLSETSAIARFLDDTFEGRKIMGATAHERGLDQMWDNRVWVHILYPIVTAFHVLHQGLGPKLELTSNPAWGEHSRKVDEKRFFGAILDALGMDGGARDGVSQRQDMAVKLMRVTDVRMLIVDELHNLLSGPPGQQRRLLNLLRWIGNELQIPLVGVGTAEALRAIRSDDQLVNRFEPMPLPLWKDGEEYRRLLSTLEAVLPLRKPSGLASAPVAARILAASGGVLGEIVALITRAAVNAVTSGAERISARMIEDARFIAPSDRRRVAI